MSGTVYIHGTHPRTPNLKHYSGVPRNFVRVVSTNSVEDSGQRERGSGGGSLVRDSAKFTNE
jgi:hypothetical protein